MITNKHPSKFLLLLYNIDIKPDKSKQYSKSRYIKPVNIYIKNLLNLIT